MSKDPLRTKKLTIVISSLPRRRSLNKLLTILLPQIDHETELIIISDYTKQSEKLNKALKIACGEYFTIIDDDDMISDDFVAKVKSFAKGYDMIGYDIYFYQGNLTEHTDDRNPYRFIHHTFKTSILTEFPDSNRFWDPPYVYSLPIESYAWIHEPLYFYLFNKNDTVQNGTAHEKSKVFN